MRLVLILSAVFGLIGCFCIVVNAQDGASHSHRDHTILTLSTEARDAVTNVQPAIPLPSAARETQSAPAAAVQTALSAIIFTHGPEMLRNLARIAMIAVQYWRA
jgi:hypothetical protein